MNIDQIKKNIESARRAYLEIVHTGNAAEVKAASDAVKSAQAELASALADGAAPCPGCGSAPHGLFQPTGVEIGCLACRDHRAQGPSRASAVFAWNEGCGNYDKCTDYIDTDGETRRVREGWFVDRRWVRC